LTQSKEIRWKQRFENFEKSYKLLEKYIQNPCQSEIERAGLIQFFEVSFELSWKLIKDYLETHDYFAKSPRESIKIGFQMELIENGHVWIEALADRNLTVHTYDENTALKMAERIKGNYFPELKKLYLKLKKEI
jgi:nucleotidyltransferase substrate binding protein (TIGR01987 family)